MIDPNILTGLLYVGSVFLFGTRWYLGLTFLFIAFHPFADNTNGDCTSGFVPGNTVSVFFICFAATYSFVVIRAIVRTSFVSTHNTTKAAGSPAKTRELAIKYQSSYRLYQNPVTMIHLVLNDLRRPAGVGFQPCLHLHGLILHFDGFIPLALARTSEKRQTSFLGIISAIFFKEPLNNSPPNPPNIQSCIK